LSFNSAGWIATTVNYLWPTALFAFGCTAPKGSIIGKSTLHSRFWHFFVSCFRCSAKLQCWPC
jgi:hypothetical protein